MDKQQPKNNTPLDRYPGSEMTIKSINEMGSKMEKIILEGLPKTKLFSDAEIVMLQFVGAMICGSLKDHEAIKDHISYFCRDLVGYANTWMKLDDQSHTKKYPTRVKIPSIIKPMTRITFQTFLKKRFIITAVF